LHRMNIGVIVSDAMFRVKVLSSEYISLMEEYFVSRMQKGDKFILAGRDLELVQIKDMTVQVRTSSGRAIAPSWLGGRLSLTSNLSYFLRQKLARSIAPSPKDKELKFLVPLLHKQSAHSHIPSQDELLVEYI